MASENFNSFKVQGITNVLVPAHLNFGKYVFDRIRTHLNKGTALEKIETRDKITYKEIAQLAVDVSEALIKLGIKKGDVVALGSEKRNDIIPIFLGVIMTGAVYSAYELNIGKGILKHKVELVKPKYIITSNCFWNTYKDILQNCNFIEMYLSMDDNPELTTLKPSSTEHANLHTFEPVQVLGQVDTAIIFYSSGTTGMPKAVERTHLNCLLNCVQEEYYMKLDCLNTIFMYGDWCHIYDALLICRSLAAGKYNIYCDENITIDLLIQSIEYYQINIATFVPSIISELFKYKDLNNYKLNSLKIITSRGSLLDGKIVEKVMERLPHIQDIIQIYGLTELGGVISEFWRPKGLRIGSIGSVCPYMIVKVVNPQTEEILGPNQEGEIRVKNLIYNKFYKDVDPAVYQDQEGYFKTGDIGYYDEDKYFYISGRQKDIIEYDGYKISPQELETIILLHPDVSEVSVIGKPVPFYGEEPTAFVIKKTGSKLDEKELIDYVNSQVPFFMELRGGVTFVTTLPKNPRGKILRFQLKEALMEANKIV